MSHHWAVRVLLQSCCVRACVSVCDRWVLFHSVCAGFMENFCSPVIESSGPKFIFSRHRLTHVVKAGQILELKGRH